MANFEQRDNQGILFKNDKRADNAKAPNAKGQAMIDGVMYWVSAWTKDGRKGKFQSLAFERMEQQPGRPVTPEPQYQPTDAPLEDDGIPF